METTTNYGLKKPAQTDYYNIEDQNTNMEAIDAALSPTADPAQAPSGLSGKLSQWVSWIANRIKAITGKANWYDAPDTTLAAAKTHMDSTGNPHATTAAQVGAAAASLFPLQTASYGDNTISEAKMAANMKKNVAGGIAGYDETQVILRLAKKNLINNLKQDIRWTLSPVNNYDSFVDPLTDNTRINVSSSSGYSVSGGKLAFSPTITNSVKFPGTVSTAAYGSITWTNPDNIKTDNNISTVVNWGSESGQMNTQYLKATNFGFSIPSNAIIKGITVTIGREGHPSGMSGQDHVTDASVKIIKSNSELGSQERASASTWPYTEGIGGYGGSTDLWGESWTYADINNNNFGVAVAACIYGASGEAVYAIIDYISITVHYTQQTQAVVVWNSVTTTEALAYIAITADQTKNSGAITWYLSDDGTNWIEIASIDTIQAVNFDSVIVYLKCVITNNAVVEAVAWGGY